jgi:hypothetical protein
VFRPELLFIFKPVRQPFVAIYQEKLIRFGKLWSIANFLLQNYEPRHFGPRNIPVLAD